MATNILKTTEIYGSLSVKDRYATYSNIGVSSGDIVVPAYFENTGNTDLNNISINGIFKLTGTAHLKNTILPQGFYANWNDSSTFVETSFINSKDLEMVVLNFTM